MNDTLTDEREVLVGADPALPGTLAFPPAPEAARGVVLFAHGSGSGRHSPRNRYVAAALREGGCATLLLDLLTPGEDGDPARRFDIALLAERLDGACEWLRLQAETEQLPIGLFGASTGAGAALQLAAARPGDIAAVVSRGGRPDLAGAGALARVAAPVLLVVGGNDGEVVRLNEGPRRRCVASTSWRSCRAPPTCSRRPARSSRWPRWRATGSCGT